MGTFRTAIVTLLFAAAAASAAWAAPPILRVRAASLDAVVRDVSTIAIAVGHPVEREATITALAQILNVPELGFVDPTKPLAFSMPVEGMVFGPKGMVAVLPVRDRAKSIAALTESFGGHTFDAGVHIFASQEGDRQLFVREAEGVLIAGPTRELLASIDPGEVLSGNDLPAGSVVFAVRAMAEGPPEPPPGPDDAQAPAQLPKEMLPLLNVYFDLLQDGIDNVSRFQLALSVEGGSIVVRNRLVAKKDSALGAFCATQVLRGSVAATKLVPEDAPMRLAGRIQWTPDALAYLSDYSRRAMDALRVVAGDADPAVVQQLDQWLELWDMTGPSQMMQCSRGDFAISTAYRPDGKQTMLEAFGLETRQACSDVLESHVERIRSNGKLRESLVEETLEPQKLKTSVVKYTGQEEVVVRMAQADDFFLLGIGEGSADAFRSVLGRRPAAKDAVVPTAPSFVTGHFDMGTMLEHAPVSEAPEGEFLRALADRIQGGAGRIELGMRFLDAAADLEIGVPLGFIDALGKAAATEAKEKAEKAANDREPEAANDESEEAEEDP